MARALELEPSSVYKSLHRLTELGLVDQRWAGRRCFYGLNQHGRDALPYARLGRRALGRQWPPDSNRVTPPPARSSLPAQRGPRRSRGRRR